MVSNYMDSESMNAILNRRWTRKWIPSSSSSPAISTRTRIWSTSKTGSTRSRAATGTSPGAILEIWPKPVSTTGRTRSTATSATCPWRPGIRMTSPWTSTNWGIRTATLSRGPRTTYPLGRTSWGYLRRRGTDMRQWEWTRWLGGAFIYLFIECCWQLCQILHRNSIIMSSFL